VAIVAVAGIAAPAEGSIPRGVDDQSLRAALAAAERPADTSTAGYRLLARASAGYGLLPRASARAGSCLSGKRHVGAIGFLAEAQRPGIKGFSLKLAEGVCDGPSMYQFAGYDPVNNGDPLGLFRGSGRSAEREADAIAIRRAFEEHNLAVERLKLAQFDYFVETAVGAFDNPADFDAALVEYLRREEGLGLQGASNALQERLGYGFDPSGRMASWLGHGKIADWYWQWGMMFVDGYFLAEGAAGIANGVDWVRRAGGLRAGWRGFWSAAVKDGAGGRGEVLRVVEPGKPQFQLRQGEQGLSVFDAGRVGPDDILPSFREGSQAVSRGVVEIEGCGLSVVCSPGNATLPKILQDAHLEIRPGEGMTRKQFKKALKGLEPNQ